MTSANDSLKLPLPKKSFIVLQDSDLVTRFLEAFLKRVFVTKLVLEKFKYSVLERYIP
jgi:hypothetical protein